MIKTLFGWVEYTENGFVCQGKKKKERDLKGPIFMGDTESLPHLYRRWI
jgi:hypothetical protein